MDRTYLHKIATVSARAFYDLIMAREEEIRQDILAVFKEADANDKKPKFTISHSMTVDLEKGFPTNIIHWSITKRDEAVGSPIHDDTEVPELPTEDDND